jgi:hypothetical protein
MTSHFSDDELVAITEANHLAHFAAIGRLSWVDFHADADATWYMTGIPFPSLNRVVSARFAADEADARIDALLGAYRARGLPSTWWTWATSTPTDLGTRLEAHGLRFQRASQGMAADLKEIDLDLPKPAGLDVIRVHDEATLQEFIDVVRLGFNLTSVAGEASLRMYRELGLGGDEPMRHYVGRVDGRPVACSTLFLGGGAAGLYSVATVLEARRRGFATELTLAPMREAREAGYDLAVMLPSPTGALVYERLGFRSCCPLSVYLAGAC